MPPTFRYPVGPTYEAENLYQSTPIFFLANGRVEFKANMQDNMCISNTFMNFPNRFSPLVYSVDK